MKFTKMIAVIGVLISGMALTQSAHASCQGKVIHEAVCKARGNGRYRIKFRVCATFGGPVEILLNGCSMTTLPHGRVNKGHIKLNGFGPGEYKIKGIGSRGGATEATVVCEG